MTLPRRLLDDERTDVPGGRPGTGTSNAAAPDAASRKITRASGEMYEMYLRYSSTPSARSLGSLGAGGLSVTAGAAVTLAERKSGTASAAMKIRIPRTPTTTDSPP